MLSVITGAALVLAGHTAQALLAKLVAPKSGVPSDPFNGLPGLSGHPVLNQLKARFDSKHTQVQSDAETALLQAVLKDVLGK